MELPSTQQGEMPIPINSTYGHMIHDSTPHNHIIIPVSVSPPRMTSINGVMEEEATPYKKMVKYRECMKNHAASMGGNATDGCGEFMPSGEEGSLEALTCSACNCHRNFHRKEIEGEASSMDFYSNPHRFGRKIIVGHPQKSFSGHHHHGHLTSRVAVAPPHHQMIMSYNMGSFPSESDEQDDGVNGGGGNDGGAQPLQRMKKRHRTKFTPEQKEKMLNFAEKAGWKIQKQEEAVVQQFCQEVGIKRRVLKVWMHNNKHNLAKKMMINTNGITDGGAQIQL